MGVAVIHDALGRFDGKAFPLWPPMAGGVPKGVVGGMLEQEVYMVVASRDVVGAVWVGGGDGWVDADKIPNVVGTCRQAHRRQRTICWYWQLWRKLGLPGIS